MAISNVGSESSVPGPVPAGRLGRSCWASVCRCGMESSRGSSRWVGSYVQRTEGPSKPQHVCPAEDIQKKSVRSLEIKDKENTIPIGENEK